MSTNIANSLLIANLYLWKTRLAGRCSTCAPRVLMRRRAHLRVKEGKAFDLDDAMVERVGEVVCNPLGNHDGDHDGQDEAHICSTSQEGQKGRRHVSPHARRCGAAAVAVEGGAG